MAKPTIVTRAGKGSALTWTEGDTNLTNLQNATISVTDGTNTAVLDLNDTLTLTAGTNITLSVNPTTDTVTINSTASGGDVVSDTTPQLGGNLDVNGYSIVSASNGNISIVPHGSGNIQLSPASGYVTISSVNFPTSTPSTGQVLYAVNGSGTLGWTTPSSGGATVLDDLTDVAITAAASDNILAFNGTNWVNVIPKRAQSTTSTSNTDYALLFSSGPGFPTDILTNTSMTINPSTGTITATKFAGAHNGTVGATTPSTGAFTTLSASSTVSGTGFTNRFASPGPIGSTTASTGAFTSLSSSGTVSGTGFTVYMLSPPEIGTTTPNIGTFTTLTVSGANELRLADSDSTNYVGFKSPATVSANKIWTLPAADGTSGQVLSTNGTGTLSWANGGGSGTVTSVGGTGTVNGLTLTGTVTTSGSLTLGGTLNLSSPPAIGSTTASTGAFTTLSASSTVSGAGFSAYLASPPSIGSTTASTGKFTSLEFKNPIEPIYAIANGSGATTLAPDCANGSVQSFNMSTATSLTFNSFTNATAGQSLTIIVTNNTISTITSTMKWAGGVKTLTGTASAIDIISVYYDGTNYYASISKGFA